MRRPLVPFDGSASATRALQHALDQLQDRAAAQLHLLNVQLPPLHTCPSKLVSPDLIDQELRRKGEALLVQAEAVTAGTRTPVVHHVRVGHPAAEIAACATEQGCDAIVMGTRGKGAVAGMLLGSVATRVVHLTQVPVTLVK